MVVFVVSCCIVNDFLIFSCRTSWYWETLTQMDVTSHRRKRKKFAYGLLHTSGSYMIMSTPRRAILMTTPTTGISTFYLVRQFLPLNNDPQWCLTTRCLHEFSIIDCIIGNTRNTNYCIVVKQDCGVWRWHVWSCCTWFSKGFQLPERLPSVWWHRKSDVWHESAELRSVPTILLL